MSGIGPFAPAVRPWLQPVSVLGLSALDGIDVEVLDVPPVVRVPPTAADPPVAATPPAELPAWAVPPVFAAPPVARPPVGPLAVVVPPVALPPVAMFPPIPPDLVSCNQSQSIGISVISALVATSLEFPGPDRVETRTAPARTAIRLAFGSVTRFKSEGGTVY